LDLQGDYLVEYNSLAWLGRPYNISIEGTICSDNININNLAIDVDGQSMTIDNLVPSGGNCFDFEASYSSSTSLIPGGFEFDFSVNSQADDSGVAQCCSDSLVLEELNESDPNIDNTSTISIPDGGWDLGDVIASLENPAIVNFTPSGVTRLEELLRTNYQMPEDTRLMLGKQVIYHIGRDNRIIGEVSSADILDTPPNREP